MQAHSFFILLAGVTLLAVLALFGLHSFERLQPHTPLSWISLGLFVLLTVAMYYAGSRALRSKNKNDFTNVVMGFTMGKMFLAIAIVFGYLKLVEPTDKLFILPFFTVYLIYTVVEVYLMMKLSRSHT